MCAILDANVAHQLTGGSQPSPGSRFLDRIDDGRIRLMIGGRLREELDQTPLRDWLRESILSGTAEECDDTEVERVAKEIEESGECVSDDVHIIALARVSKARLLYTNDRNLQADFRNKRLIDKPRGRIYTTLRYQEFHKTHQNLLNRTDLCSAG